ncbi:hypothetical protein BV20DRAFT_1056078 [Pilatotrama ljubarskyi]|nr:hypothetical protein BV20DRAFT_1056078 [Pilatotrama ljubarskyi]
MSSTHHLPALHMSHLIAPDAPLTSPISDSLSVPWDRDPALTALYDPFSLPLSASPPGSGMMPGAMPDTRKVLRSRMTPDESVEQCLPTHQVFDFVPGATAAQQMCSSPASTPESSPQAEPQQLPQRGAAMHHHTSSFSAAGSPAPSAGSVVVPSKRPSVGPTSAATKKARGERITTKDFVPPDVTGLSKREARLVKNRAAAFLSRQRKREEFENMEIRVAELEQENARLLALAQQQQQGGHAPASSASADQGLLSEVEQLRRQLAETQQRERELAAKLSSVPAEATSAVVRKADGVKVEAVEPQLPASLRAHKGERSGASLGLMVLLCALPTLLSMPAHHAMSSSGVSFNPPPSHHSHSHSHSTSLDMATFPTSSDYDWNLGFGSGGAMDLDLAPSSLTSTEERASTSGSEFKKLEFVDVDAEKLGLSGLDISFDASAAKDGRIRVRIHPPSATGTTSSSASDNGSDGSAHLKEQEEDQTMWHDAEDDLGPFLGIGANDFGFDHLDHPEHGLQVPSSSSLSLGYPPSSYSSLSSFSGSSSSPSMVSSPTNAFFTSAPSPGSSQMPNEYEFELGSEYGSVGSGMSRAGSPGALGGGRRRVRIALRGMPGKGKEGGEWEVEVC